MKIILLVFPNPMQQTSETATHINIYFKSITSDNFITAHIILYKNSAYFHEESKYWIYFQTSQTYN